MPTSKYVPDADTRGNLNLFYQPVLMPGGWQHDHVRTLRKIDLYYNSRFETGENDSQGRKKHFYNIVKPACDTASKFCDLDTKDVLLYADSKANERLVWVMQQDLRRWLKEKKIGVLLNEIVTDYPKYGKVVVKKGKDNQWRKVNIQNLRMDPSAPTLEESGFVYEVLSMTRRQISEMGWDKDAVQDLFRSSRDASFIIYECYDYNLEEGNKWLRTFKANFNLKRSQNGVIETAESQLEKTGDYLPGVTLYSDEMDETPYRELDWEKIPGRWLPLGFVEYLFENQVRLNELANLKAAGLHYTSLKVFQTQDEGVNRNLLTDVQNGDILTSQSPITPIDMSEKNLAHFNQEEMRWDKNIDQKAFTFDVARGGDLPSQTPLGVAKLTAGMVASFFELKREAFGLFLREVILADVIPQFVRERQSGAKIKVNKNEPGYEQRAKEDKNILMRDRLMKTVLRQGLLPEPQDVAKMDQEADKTIRERKSVYYDLPEGGYKGLEYDIDINITGEQVDVSAKVQTLQTVLTIIGGNPAILQDPGTRAIFFRMLSLVGVSPVELDLMEDKAQDVPQQQQMQPQPMQMPQGQGQGMVAKTATV